MVTHEDAEKLTVTKADFEHALTYDIKPAFGISDEQLDNYVFNGMVASLHTHTHTHTHTHVCMHTHTHLHALSLFLTHTCTHTHTGIIPWGPEVQELLDVGKTVVDQTKESVRTPLVSILLRGRYSYQELTKQYAAL